MKDNIQDDLKYLTKILGNRGYAIAGKSPTQADTQKIEHPPKGAEYNSQKLFDLFNFQPLCRLIFQFMIIENIDNGNTLIDLDKFTNFIYEAVKENNIQHAVAESPVEILVCPKCKSSNYEEIKRGYEFRLECRSCETTFNRNELKEIGDWKLVGLFDIYRILSRLCKTGFVLEQNQAVCYECEKVESFSIIETKKHIECKKCRNVQEIKRVYSTIDFSSFRDIKAAWFEWYVYKILKEKCKDVQHVIPSHKIKNIQTDQETEVDVLAITENDKIISVDGKAKFLTGSLSRNDVNNAVLDWMQFTDYLIIITTTKISDNTKEFWINKLNACKTIFIQGNEIEKLPEILLNRLS